MPMAEMGQAIYTGSAMLLAEELVDFRRQVGVEHYPANAALYGMPLLGGQTTGGSTCTGGTVGVLREAGLLVSRRHRHPGLYERTPRGRALVSGYAP